jgi:hypothetical protein
VVIEFGRTPTGQLVAVDEFYRRNTHVDDAIRWLEERPDGQIHSEHAPADIERFKNAGWRVEKADKDIDAGIDEVRNRLEDDEDDDETPGLLVSDRCENLIREFLGYKEDHVGKSAATDHGLDVTRYVCMGEVSSKPKGGGVVIDWGGYDSNDYLASNRR